MKHLLLGIAAVALAAGGVHANPGKGNGNGNGNGGNAAAAKAGKPDKARGNANRGNGPSAAMRADRKPAKTDGNRGRNQAQAGPPPAARGNNGNGNGNAARVNDRRYDRDVERRIERRVDRRVEGRYDRDVRGSFTTAGVIDGCPPGLAKKRNGCQPPGQAKKNGYGYEPAFFGYGDRYAGDYFYRDGYLLRRSGSNVSGWLPLLGGALSIGNAWPDNYRGGYLPSYYENYYDLGSRNNYRYADQVVYRLDPETEAITSITALLTGDQFTVGQPVPSGYDVYNVPSAYRDQYYDRPDRYYRYSDGYVYQVDPETRLVAAAIELLI